MANDNYKEKSITFQDKSVNHSIFTKLLQMIIYPSPGSNISILAFILGGFSGFFLLDISGIWSMLLHSFYVLGMGFGMSFVASRGKELGKHPVRYIRKIKSILLSPFKRGWKR